ncbi:MAG: hypothetical protein IT366_15945 [Candidatus Hydrogenedentes bacterium]|nr:hypothetical protein [Candidatus Hydrogenedentota bacterium]
MADESQLRRVTLFALRLMLITPVLLALWWLSMPLYARVIGECAAVVLRVMGYPIERVVVNAHGFLNTDTTLGFALGGSVPTAPISWVVTNVAIYISLILATRRMKWNYRARALGIGLATLLAAHIAHVVVFFAFAPAIERNPQVPTAIAQILITLPFLLWIVLAYWNTPSPMPSSATPNHVAERESESK